MSPSIAGAPPNVAAALSRLKSDLTEAAGTNLVGLILYGGLARGRYRPGKSDVNVIVLLRDASASGLSQIAPALQAAWRSAAVEPLVLAEGEVAAAASAFPTKFLDIRDHHIVLAGSNPFAGLTVPDEHVRLRIEQELRNLLLRLRRRYIAVSSDTGLLTLALARIARPFALQLEALLRLSGKPALADDRTSAIFVSAAAAFGLAPEPLARLAELRQASSAIDGASALYHEVLAAIARAADVAGQMKESPR